MYFKAKNISTGRYINKFLDAGKNIAIINPYGHWFEAEWTIVHQKDFHWTIFTAIKLEKIDVIKDLIKRRMFVIDTMIAGKNATPLIYAGYVNNFEICKLLIEAGADWSRTDISGNDFLAYLSDDNRKRIIEKYTEEYELYLTKKEAEKYNL